MEGAEYRVLQGFRGMLEAGRIGIIQFETGAATTLLARRPLKDFWEMLAGYRFDVGKLMPASVKFGPYSPRLELKWANFVAVHESRRQVLNTLTL